MHLMGTRKPHILFIYKDFSHFTRKDYETLGTGFRVIKIRSPFGKSLPSFLWAGFLQFIRLIWFVPRCNLLFCWFADYHSFLPALFSRLSGKPLYIVLGGYDVTHVEELNYGSFSKKFRAFCTRYSMRVAAMNLPVAEALGAEARERAGEIRIKVMPTGYDPELYLPSRQKEDIVLTVSLTSSWQRYMIKGIDRFIELAHLMPSMQFVVIGMDQDAEQLIQQPPPNLVVLPPSDHKALLEWYGKARFYAQFSRSEGLPNAVCEAMLRNCIPLGVRTGGIPDAIGEAGILLDEWDAEEMARSIKECPDPDELARAARQHTIDQFHIERREKELMALLK